MEDTAKMAVARLRMLAINMTHVILSAAKNLDPVRGFEILHPDKSGFRMTKSVDFRQNIFFGKGEDR